MKKWLSLALLIITVGFVIASCDSMPVHVNVDTSPLPTPTPDYTRSTTVGTGFYSDYVKRFVDDEAGVVCWIVDFARGGGISCLPISQTNLGQ